MASELLQPTRFCRCCLYALSGLPENRCPECGTTFDPDDRKTFLPTSRKPHTLDGTGWLLDAGCVLLAVSYLCVFLYACRQNIIESPTYGGGSSYTERALCNDAFVTNYPIAAAFIADLPLGLFAGPGVPAVLASLFTAGAAPFLLWGCLGVRTIRCWRMRRRRAVLVAAFVPLTLMLPFLRGSVTVFLD